MQQIVCPKCKALADAGLNFCPSCGAPLPLPNSNGGTPGERLTQVNQQHVAKAILNEGKKKENPKVALVVGVVTVVLVIGIIAALIITAGGSSSTDTNSGTTSTVESSSAPESSDSAIATPTESSADESSAIEESSVAESSIESSLESVESTTEVSTESSAESIAEPAASEVVIKAEKPDDWTDIYAYVYTKELATNAEWPGEAMTDNGDNTYSYTVPSTFDGKDAMVIFSTTATEKGATHSKQYPYQGKDGYSISEKTTFTVSDFESYASEKAAQ